MIVAHERPGTRFVLWAWDGYLAGPTADTADRVLWRIARELFGDR